MTDNSKHLLAYKKKEREEKIEAVNKVISYLLYNSEEINVNLVAKKANVSRTFIYNNPELRLSIQDNKASSKIRADKKKVNQGRARSQESQMVIISTLKRRIKDLQKELELSKKDNSKLRAYISQYED